MRLRPEFGRGAGMRWRLLALVFGWVWVLGGARAWGHDAGLSTAQVRCAGGTVEIVAGFSFADAQLLLPAGERVTGTWSTQEFEARKSAWSAIARQLWEVRTGEEAPAAVERVNAELVAADNVNFRTSYAVAAGARVRLKAQSFGKLPPGHREFVTVEDATGVMIARKLLSARNDAVEFQMPHAEGNWADAPAEVDASGRAAVPGTGTFGGFVRLGVAHIWTGYDHLLFLFALLVVCRSFRGIVAIVSCFTLAHSITLALATLGWIELPGRLVEASIAASIVYVGAENLLRRGKEPKGRWAVTFAFGLVHGLGFASVLRDLGVGDGGRGLVVPLVAFNAGVEFGQVAIAAIVLPVVWRLRRKDWFASWGVTTLSALVAALGLWWLVERVTS